MLRILMLCLAAALVCMMIRTAHPQIATAVALGCGVAVMLLSAADIGSFSDALQRLEDAAGTLDGERLVLLKLCGVAMVAEFASDICRDAGEAALTKRIDTGVRIGIVAAALPTAARLMEDIAELLS
ncbi:MAG: hypothetical protein IJ466_10875 [Clostridia bacterium]|nr:hypothetical protein [Clostridia bacterium]